MKRRIYFVVLMVLFVFMISSCTRGVTPTPPVDKPEAPSNLQLRLTDGEARLVWDPPEASGSRNAFIYRVRRVDVETQEGFYQDDVLENRFIDYSYSKDKEYEYSVYRIEDGVLSEPESLLTTNKERVKVRVGGSTVSDTLQVLEGCFVSDGETTVQSNEDGKFIFYVTRGLPIVVSRSGFLSVSLPPDHDGLFSVDIDLGSVILNSLAVETDYDPQAT